jgi:gamma-aminobutyric acid receptor subunit alpha
MGARGIDPSSSLAQFDLMVSMNNEYNTDYYDIPYPGLILKLVMIRKLSYHLVQTYIPSTIYLTVSWLALFVPPQSIAERLAMAMTIMLTLTAMFASERQNVPR